MIIASIDVMNGKAVQLRQGREKVLEVDDLLGLAKGFHRYGEVALIDLDQALERGSNQDALRPLLGLAECRVGGGIRTIEKAKQWISWGARKVIVGTAAFAGGGLNEEFLAPLKETLGRNRIVVAVDARGGQIVTHGWRQPAGIDSIRAAQCLEPYCSEILYTCVEREGLMQGIDRERVQELAKATPLKLTVAGGVSTMSEVEELAALGVDVQLGMALYRGKVDLGEGFVRSLNWKSELLPTLVQDEEGRVCMLGYSSRESLRRTLALGRMWFHSRSRGKLWMKGETSGNVQEVIMLRADCDRDTLLATVRQVGPTCHTGEETCFGPKAFTLKELERVIGERLREPRPGSYTATLDREKTSEKLREEIEELIAARRDDEVVWEAADVLYFLLVYLAQAGITLDQVTRELYRRRQK